MSNLFSQLMTFFGLVGTPATFAEFIPWYMAAVCAICVFISVFKMLVGCVSIITRFSRW